MTRMLAIAACTGVALAAGGVSAGEVKVVKSGPALDDMKVTRDKDTGKLRAPTDAEIADLRASSVTIAPHLLDLVRPVTTVEVRADGSAVAKRSLADMDHLIINTAGGKPVLQHARKAKAPTAPAADLPKE